MITLVDLSSQEAQRLEALHRYGILDTEPEAAFDRIVSLAQRLFKMPIVLVSLVTDERQWFKACHGLDIRETGVDVSFCAHAIRQDGVMVVPNATCDLRFQENPLVTGEPGIRFYAGAPLKTSDRYSLGTLCLIDTVPHAELTEEAREILTDLAAMVVDELELRRVSQQLEQLAHYDPVTNLPNRRLFDDRLKQAAAQSRRSGRPLAAMFLDLDNFKHVNDTYGHAFGDALLREVAGRLGQSVREGDTVARWGGDEFVVMVPEFGVISEIKSLAERLLEALRQPFLVGGQEIRTTVTIGVDTSDGASASAEDLVKNADIALYRAKAARGSYVFFTHQMKEHLRLRVEFGKELRAVLATNKLTLHYQPRVDLNNGKISSLEALARWSHPTKGWIPPSTFIPLAEELGLIRELGAQVLDLACAQAKVWQEAGLARRVAVNLSAEQLHYPHVVEEVRSTLARHDLNPALLELEVTESTAMADIEGGIARLQQLRELGIHLAIDDFGTAYSSLAYLKQLPVHSLKIDRAFINDLGGPSMTGEANIVQAIVALARSFSLRVIAEGVETERQRLALQELGCDEAQGYLFAKPLPPGEVTDLLEASRMASSPVAFVP